MNRTISSDSFDLMRSRVDQWLSTQHTRFQSRILDRHIVDSHGDVRCESISVTNGICIFDCIEFNERSRCGDTSSEVAFLAMDLDFRGLPDFGYHFTDWSTIDPPGYS